MSTLTRLKALEAEAAKKKPKRKTKANDEMCWQAESKSLERRGWGAPL